jgi:hypothetical protein
MYPPEPEDSFLMKGSITMSTATTRILILAITVLVLTSLQPAGAEKKGGVPMKAVSSPLAREKEIDGFQVKIDMTGQVLAINIPEDRDYGEKSQKVEPPLFPTAGQAMQGGRFVSASMLAAKAKQFDDGLYAAVDMAAQNGCGTYAGKKAMLMKIEQALKKEAATRESHNARVLLYSAIDLGGQAAQDEKAVVKDAADMKAEFMKNELRSKPIGFYTWNEELEKIFRQDRMLQEKQKTVQDAMPLAAAIKASGMGGAYGGYMRLNEGLTNPLIGEVSDLRPLIDGKAHPNGPFAMFPPSRAHETELIKKLYGNRPIPEGFNLIDKLVEEIRAGRISLKPGKSAGWYDYQTYALEPLVLPEKTAEAAKLDLGERYRKELVNLFKSLLALTRETHIKQLEIPACGAGMPQKALDIYPDLTLEPLATYYQRRAASYVFVRKVLEGTFGADGLKQMHRLTKSGPVKISLDQELRDMERLFTGAHDLVCAEIGCPVEGALSKEAMDAARSWMQSLARDPDIGADNRMMVPVFYDLQRKKTKVWAVLGYDAKPLTIGFSTMPTVEVFDRSGKKATPRVQFHHSTEKLIYPVMAEVYVTKILNRDEFRKICDRERSASKILAALGK